MLSAPIFNICEVKRIALTILFRFNAMADRVNPKICVNSNWGANRAKLIQGGSRVNPAAALSTT